MSVDKEATDIAEDPSSLASFLARNMAQMTRVYTTTKNRIKLRDHLKEEYSDSKEIRWFPPS